jgi:AraC-like DNA-binding protein
MTQGRHPTPPDQKLDDRIRRLLREGKTYSQIIGETGKSKKYVQRISQACFGVRKSKRATKDNPTACAHERGCTCTWHQAEAVRAERLAAKRNEIKAKGVL